MAVKRRIREADLRGGRGASATKPLRILIVSPELAQDRAASTRRAGAGQAGEVARRLPPALAQLGHHLTVLVPAPAGVGRIGVGGAVPDRSLVVTVGDETHEAHLRGVHAGGCDYLFVGNESFFDRTGSYLDRRETFVDNGARFGFLAAVAEAVAAESPVDIVHGLDWPGGLALLRCASGPVAVDPAPSRILSFFEVGNRGVFDVAVFHELGLPSRMLGLLRVDGRLDVLRGGLAMANLIVAPSGGLVRELQGGEHGGELGDVLVSRETDTVSIVGGIEESEWDPRTDRYLKSNYSSEELVGKRSCKLDLQGELNLVRDVDQLLVAVVGRLDGEHGADLVAETFAAGSAAPVQLAVVANGGRGHHDRLRQMARRSGGRVGVAESDQELMLRKALAGADLLLDASPCEGIGLDVMRAMRYGTLPIVRGSGAHADLVTDASLPDGDGFKLEDTTPRGLLQALGRAVDFSRREHGLAAMIERAMARDRSWAACARAYERAYRRTTERSASR